MITEDQRPGTRNRRFLATDKPAETFRGGLAGGGQATGPALSSLCVPVHDAAALVAGGERGQGVDHFAAGGGFDFAGNLQVAATAFTVVDGDDGRHVAGGDAVVDAQLR